MREKGELNHCEENKVQDFLWPKLYCMCENGRGSRNNYHHVVSVGDCEFGARHYRSGLSGSCFKKVKSIIMADLF